MNIRYEIDELVDASDDQLERLHYYPNFFQSPHSSAIELSQLLSQVTPKKFDHTFCANSGSESANTVVRLARFYWNLLGHPRKRIIINRKDSYHGSTVTTERLSGMSYMHLQGVLPIPEIDYIEQPYWYKKGDNQNQRNFGKDIAR